MFWPLVVAGGGYAGWNGLAPGAPGFCPAPNGFVPGCPNGFPPGVFGIGPRRIGESIGMMLAPLTDALMMGPLRRYRSIHADEMGRAIAALIRMGGSGVHIHENQALVHLSG